VRVLQFYSFTLPVGRQIKGERVRCVRACVCFSTSGTIARGVCALAQARAAIQVAVRWELLRISLSLSLSLSVVVVVGSGKRAAWLLTRLLASHVSPARPGRRALGARPARPHRRGRSAQDALPRVRGRGGGGEPKP
jgi:hypothetical protein